MAKWQRHIYLNPQWKKADDGEITRQALAASIAEKIKALAPFGDAYVETRREELIDAFRDASEDADLQLSDFNDLMSELYDWGDIEMDGHWNGRKVCWIDTFTERETA